MKVLENELECHPLKVILQRRGLSQVWLAKKLGISIPTLNSYLNKYRLPPPEIQEQLDLIKETLSAEDAR